MTGPVFEQDPAPEHGPTFWADLGASLERDQEASASRHQRVDPAEHPPGPPGSTNRWRGVLAAAAAVLLIAGAGFVATRAGGDDVSDVASVGEPAADDAPALDGPTEAEGTDPDGRESATALPEPVDEPDTDRTEPIGTPVAEEQTPPARPAVDYVAAVGNDDSIAYVPLAGQMPDDARFVATWEDQRVSWYSVEGGECTDLRHSQLVYVNEAQIALPVHDPQLYFSGEIQHFTVDETVEPSMAAWLAVCGEQAEFYVASVSGTGLLAEVDLVWIGHAQTHDALIQWTGAVVNLSVFDDDGPFFVEYDTETSEGAGRIRQALVTSVDGQRLTSDPTPIAALPNGEFSYWNGVVGDLGGCEGSELWLRSGAGDGTWGPALVESIDLGGVSALAINDVSQVALADSCGALDGRVWIASLREDGRLTDLVDIDLSPYVPGFASALHWVDDSTLRIVTDNDAAGVRPVSFDLHVEDGLIEELN